MHIFLKVLIILITFSFSSLSFAQPPVNASFKDWKVNCDKFNVCSATTTFGSTYNGLADYIFSLRRNEFQEYWEISLIANKGEPYKSDFVKFSTDKKEIKFAAPQEFAAYGNLNHYYFLGEKAQILFDEILPADKMKISFAETEIEFSLSGLSASLLLIDEKQDRVGSAKTAGEAPNNEIIVTSREPDKFPDYLMQEHNNPKFSGCDPLQELAHGPEISSFRLDATTTLFLVPCSAGAYNFSSVVYIKDAYETRMQVFASYWEGNGWSGERQLVNPNFNEITNILGDFYKGRGLADCGTSGVWQWNKYSFKMLEYRSKAACDGKFENDEIGKFPIVYQDPNYKSNRGD